MSPMTKKQWTIHELIFTTPVMANQRTTSVHHLQCASVLNKHQHQRDLPPARAFIFVTSQWWTAAIENVICMSGTIQVTWKSRNSMNLTHGRNLYLSLLHVSVMGTFSRDGWDKHYLQWLVMGGSRRLIWKHSNSKVTYFIFLTIQVTTERQICRRIG